MAHQAFLIKTSKEKSEELFEANNTIPLFWFALLDLRGGLICLDKVCRFLSGISACGYAASCTVDSITAYASSGVFFCNLECGLQRLYQSR